MPRALFCWENGEGSGHVVPYLSLVEALIARGWQVAVAAKNTAEVGARVQASGALLLQAPVCVSLFADLDQQSFSTTELLLQHGYGHAPTLDGIFSAWLGLMQVWQPDLVIGSGAPASHLAAQCLGIPDIAIGSGFNCPIAVNPAPLMRAWQPGIEQRISQSEDRALQTINAVMTMHGFAKRAFAMDMFFDVPQLLCTVAELDHFSDFRKQADYLGMPPPTASSSLPQSKSGNNGADAASATAAPCDVFVYLRVNKSAEALLASLAKLGVPTLAYIPGLTMTQRLKWEAAYSPAIKFSVGAVDIEKMLMRVRLVVSNAGHNLTLQTLLAGKPLLLFPNHWEQGVVAQRAAKIGAAIEVQGNDPHPKFRRWLDDLLNQPLHLQAAQRFAERYAQLSSQQSLEQAVSVCESRAFPQRGRAQLISVR